MEYHTSPTDYFKLRVLYIIVHNFRRTKMFATKSIVIKIQGNKDKYHTNPNDTMLFFRNICSPISKYYCAQLEFTYRVFTECLNLCDVGDNLSNTNKPTMNLLPELQYDHISNYGVFLNCVEEICEHTGLNKVITQLGKPLNSYRRVSQRTLLHDTRQQV